MYDGDWNNDRKHGTGVSTVISKKHGAVKVKATFVQGNMVQGLPLTEETAMDTIASKLGEIEIQTTAKNFFSCQQLNMPSAHSRKNDLINHFSK